MEKPNLETINQGEATPLGTEMRGSVLYDRKNERYFMETKSEEQPQFTKDLEQARYFSVDEVSDAWHIAYKLAWLDCGKFYVYGIKK